MDFRLTDDQRALREGLRSFCEGRVPLERLRELEQATALDRAFQAELAEMGVFSLRLPEADGGVGLGNADAALVFAELGRRLVPGPLAWTHLAAGLVDGAADGRAIVGGVDAHAKFRALGPLGGTLDRYRDLFRLLTTHVLVRERTAPAILEALREGRSYVAFEGLAAVDRFEASREADGVRLRAPREARLVLVCAGVVAGEALAAEALLPAPANTDRCHAEAWLGDRLWIVTSRL